MDQTCVAGEPLELLFEALLQVKWRKGRDGMSHATARLEPRLAQPFFRALMRVQAELLLQDADRLGTPDAGDRTHEQRAADAFLALALRITDALGEQRKAS